MIGAIKHDDVCNHLGRHPVSNCEQQGHPDQSLGHGQWGSHIRAQTGNLGLVTFIIANLVVVVNLIVIVAIAILADQPKSLVSTYKDWYTEVDLIGIPLHVLFSEY